MNSKGSFKKEIVYKWLSFSLLLGFLYYWLFTFSLVFFNKATRTAAPKQALVYSSFFNQNWRLFSATKTYSSEVNLVIRKINDPLKSDTLKLVRYSMAERRKYAPFNNYQEALDRLLILIITEIADIAERNKLLLKNQFPGQDENFYVKETSVRIEKDSRRQAKLKNLRNYSKYVLAEKHIDISGKEFQFIIVHNYIDPPKTMVDAPEKVNDEKIFISTFQPL